jgi:hypothetical protein
MKQMENKKCVLQSNSWVLTSNILARKSGEGPLPYCKFGAKLKGYNRMGPLVSGLFPSDIPTKFYTYFSSTSCVIHVPTHLTPVIWSS